MRVGKDTPHTRYVSHTRRVGHMIYP